MNISDSYDISIYLLFDIFLTCTLPFKTLGSVKKKYLFMKLLVINKC